MTEAVHPILLRQERVGSCCCYSPDCSSAAHHEVVWSPRGNWWRDLRILQQAIGAFVGGEQEM